MGNLLYEDVQSYADCDKKEFAQRTSANVCEIYRALFELKHKQEAKHGPDGEILEHEKAEHSV